MHVKRGSVERLLVELEVEYTEGIDGAVRLRVGQVVVCPSEAARDAPTDRVVVTQEHGMMRVLLDGIDPGFTLTEHRVLSEIVLNARVAVSRRRIAIAAFGTDLPGYLRNVDAHVSRIRRKLRLAAGTSPILTARGVGYVFDPARLKTAGPAALATMLPRTPPFRGRVALGRHQR